MKTGARVNIEGEVTAVTRGDVMSLAKVAIPADAVVSSVMTTESLEAMGLQAGDKVKVVIKAINVLLMKD